jgi:LPS export ABC transporter protein LptC
MWVKKLTIIIAGICSTTFFISCNNQENAIPQVYDGPLREAEDIIMYHTEKDKMKTLLKAKKINELQNGDREFPEGIYLEFYDPSGKITSTLRANKAYYYKAENKWQGIGDVEIINEQKQEQLNTEELFWKQDTRKIFTEKFVTIKQQNEILYGTGLEADQDLSNYKLKKITGEFEVEE